MFRCAEVSAILLPPILTAQRYQLNRTPASSTERAPQVSSVAGAVPQMLLYSQRDTCGCSVQRPMRQLPELNVLVRGVPAAR